MKNKFEIINSHFFYPISFFLYGVLYILIGEKLPANNGLGWDGLTYACITENLLYCKRLDFYLIFRIIPSVIVHFGIKFFSVQMNTENIVRGFEILNMVSVITGIFFIQKLFDLFKVKNIIRHLGFILLIINYFILKFIFYYPVLTDSFGFAVTTALLYFYFSKNQIALLITTLIAAFSWPLVFYFGLLFLLFPYNEKGIAKEYSPYRIIPYLASVIGVFAVWYIIIYKGMEPKYQYVLLIDNKLLPISAWWCGILFYCIGMLVSQRGYYKLSFLRQIIRYDNLILVIITYFFVQYLGKYLNYSNTLSEYSTPEHLLSIAIRNGVAEPAVNMVAHISFFGTIAILACLYWNRLVKASYKLGVGYTSALTLSLTLFLMHSESRILISIFILIIFLVIIALKDEDFSILKITFIAIISLLISKVWLVVDYDLINGNVDKFGSIGFPNQKFFMHLGSWMSKDMWLLQLICYFVISVFIYLFFVRTNKKKVNSSN